MRSLLVGLALLAVGLLASALTPVRAGAEGPAAFSLSSLQRSSAAQTSEAPLDVLSASFAGFVSPNVEGRMASHVRAVGQTATGETVSCGTARVATLDNGLGFYRITVVSEDVREGCPRLGTEVRFRLLYGRVDDGVNAVASRDTTFAGGNTSTVSLSPAARQITAQAWEGDLSLEVAELTWHGESGRPVADALAELSRPVTRVWRWDAATHHFLVYVPDGPEFLQTLQVVDHGDTVHIRF